MKLIHIAIMVALLLIHSACDRTPDKPAPASLVSTTSKGDPGVQVKELTDASNPYRESYREWDEWTYLNIHSIPTIWEDGNAPEGWGSMRGVVDAAGYLVPHLEYVRGEEDARVDGTQSTYYQQFTTVYGEGDLDPELKAARFEAALMIKAAYYPDIPDWLVADPPLKVMLFPNGDVITLGQTGDYAKYLADGEACCPVIALCRYSAEGELIRQLKEYEAWWQFYYDEAAMGTPDGEFSVRKDGYIVFKDRLSDSLLSVWDYDGTPLNTTKPPPARDAHNFTWIPAEKLKKYYTYQNEASTDLQ